MTTKTERKCTAFQGVRYDKSNPLYGISDQCGAPAVYLCRDYYGRFILPRCEFCGEAFQHKRRIEK